LIEYKKTSEKSKFQKSKIKNQKSKKKLQLLKQFLKIMGRLGCWLSMLVLLVGVSSFARCEDSVQEDAIDIDQHEQQNEHTMYLNDTASASTTALNISTRNLNFYDNSDLIHNLFKLALNNLEDSVKKQIAADLGVDVALIHCDRKDELTKAIIEAIVDKLNYKLAKLLQNPCKLPENYSKLCLNDKIKLLMRNSLKAVIQHFFILIKESQQHNPVYHHESSSHEDSESHSVELYSHHSSESHHSSSEEHHNFFPIFKKYQCAKLLKNLIYNLEKFFNKGLKKNYKEVGSCKEKFNKNKVKMLKLLHLIEQGESAGGSSSKLAHKLAAQGHYSLNKIQHEFKSMLAQFIGNVEYFFKKNQDKHDQEILLCKKKYFLMKQKLGKLLELFYLHKKDIALDDSSSSHDSSYSQENSNSHSHEDNSSSKKEMFFNFAKKFNHN
jgi:hypothetical protein